MLIQQKGKKLCKGKTKRYQETTEGKAVGNDIVYYGFLVKEKVKRIAFITETT